MNATPLNKLKLITLRKQPQYLVNGVLKYGYNQSNNIIIYSTCSTGYHSFDSQWNIYVLVFNPKKMTQIKKYVNHHYKTLLPLFCVVCADYLLITKAVSKQVYEMATECTPFAMGGTYIKEMGGVLIEPNVKVDATYKGAKFPLIYEVKPQDYTHITPNVHGWLSLNTEYILRYVISNHKNTQLNVVELGAWLGRSTVEMLKAAGSSKSINIYSFDKYQNICETDYKFDKPSPLDKFWFTVPRYETFCRNVSDHIDENRHVYTIKYDVNDSIEMLRKNFIMPDIVFLDAIKSAKKLDIYLTAIFKYAPKIVFVGDDYIIETVKEGVRQFHSRNKHLHLFTTADCYILSAAPIEANRIDAYIKKELQDNYIENLVYNLFACKYSDVINMLKKKAIDVNQQIDFCNNNTFYTLVVIEIYSKKNKEAIALQKYILQNIDPAPKKIENSLFLTYKDYINEYNRGAPIDF